MRGTLDRCLCWMGWHAFELEYRSAPGLFNIAGKDYEIQGEVERCARPNCRQLYFTYKHGLRVECSTEGRARRFSASERKGRVLVLA